MDKEQTKEFPDARSFEERVLSELVAIRTHNDRVEQRLLTLEDRVDARLRETRPIWEAVKSGIEWLDEKLDNMIRDLYEVRADIGLHDKRLKEIERLNS